MSCDCHSSLFFLYVPVGHVVLRIKHIRKLLVKGPSYREQNDINWSKIEAILVDAVPRYKVQWARKERFDARLLNKWLTKVIVCIRNRIGVLNKKKRMRSRKEQVLRNQKHLHYLKQFQQHVPADKACSNIIVVCKKYYIEVVLNELSNAGQPSK